MLETTTTQTRRDWLHHAMAASAAVASLGFTGQAAAQTRDWPTRPVRLVVAFAAGSTGDLLARLLAPRLESVWKQPVIVENKPGAGGVLGTEYVARATDGHTLLLGTLSSLLPKYTVANLRFDPLADIVPVYRLVNYQLILAINAKTAAKARTLPALVDLSKSTPNGLFFAGTGPASIFNLCMAVLNRSIGLRYAAVDFNNIAAMAMAVLRDDAQVMVNSVSAVKTQIDAGEIAALAAIGAERFSILPDVPTIVEAAGYKGFMPLSWGGIFAPKGTPQAVVDRIGRDLLTLLSDAEFKTQLETRVSGTILRSSPAAFAREYQDEAKVWKEVFAAMNYVPQ